MGGPMITKSGVIFIGGLDGCARARDRSSHRRRAVEGARRPAGGRQSGEVQAKGRRCVVFAAGGNASLKPHVQPDHRICAAHRERPKNGAAAELRGSAR